MGHSHAGGLSSVEPPERDEVELKRDEVERHELERFEAQSDESDPAEHRERDAIGDEREQARLERRWSGILGSRHMVSVRFSDQETCV